MVADETNGGERRGRSAHLAAMNLATHAEFNAADFLAIASHDLLTPLETITNVASRISERSSAPVADVELRRLARHILEHAGRMEEFIQALDGDTLQDGRLRLTTAEHDLAQLVNQTADLFVPLARARSIGVARDVTGPARVHCDASRIVQMLSNLIDNALKFTPVGGSIKLRVCCQWPNCEITIVDTGIGVAKSRLATIFAAAPARGLDEYGRRPLGLYVSRSIVEAHSGRIWAEGQPGSGTTLHVRLPLA
jgi:signal transduction histidine kinase